MVRTARRRSESGYYHITMRGDGGLQLFDDDSDRNHFLALLQESLVMTDISAVAWCLMDNHVHLLVHDLPFRQSEAIHRVSSTYAQRYNRRSCRHGHVFQGRFGSFPIEDEAHLLSAVRYIHLNPERAGLCGHDTYRWSSYGDYLGLGGFAETSVILEMVGGVSRFVELSKARRDEAPYRASRMSKVDDDDALPLACHVLGRDVREGMRPTHVRELSRAERAAALRALRHAGLGISQIARLTGLGTATIKRSTSPKAANTR